jgi:V/A-type H+-transporting ATPase subunit E
MEAKEVVEKILSQAKVEAEKILAEAKSKASEEESKLASELSEYRQQTQSMADSAGADKKMRMLAAARMEIRKELTASKNVVLDEVFAGATEQIKTLSDQDYQKLITSLITEAVETGDEQVVIGKDETRIDHALIKNVNRSLGSGFKGNLVLAEDRANIDGGFILRRGSVRINASIGVLLDQVKEQIETELAAELFG